MPDLNLLLVIALLIYSLWGAWQHRPGRCKAKRSERG